MRRRVWLGCTGLAVSLIACGVDERNPPGPRPPLDDDSAMGDDDDDVQALGHGDPGGARGGACPPNTVLVDGDFCIDRFEAPNTPGGLPLVMYTFVEAASWCALRAKRLCFDDEWTRACAGSDELSYPYGDDHDPGVCNDDETWLLYDQELLNGWPSSASAAGITSLDELWEAARAVSTHAAAAADHVEWLYQAEPAGANAGCTAGDDAYDLCGNVEEWTRRRDGGSLDFHGNLKGRYWAESRTCQSNITTHGDTFRFYEIGFRCCRDPVQ
jgi:formylglycine-generating enzyme required for sulfatase activity